MQSNGPLPKSVLVADIIKLERARHWCTALNNDHPGRQCKVELCPSYFPVQLWLQVEDLTLLTH